MSFGRIRMLAVILITIMLVSMFALPAVSATEAENDNEGGISSGVATGTVASAEYQAYLDSIAKYGNAKEDIELPLLNYTAEGVEDEGREGASVIKHQPYEIILDPIARPQDKNTVDCLVWGDNANNKQQGTISYEVTVPADGIYNLAFTYLPLTKTGNDADDSNDKPSTSAVTLSVQIDGKIPYAGLGGFDLPRMFVNEGSTYDNPTGTIREDTLKNQLTPEQVEYGQFVTKYAVDPTGVVADPFKIMLTAGTHVITIKSVYEPIALASIVLKAPEVPVSYEEYNSANSGKADYSGSVLEFEGESAWLKSTNSLVAKADNSSCDITPNSPVKSILNYIGSTNWQVPGESISWVIEVPEDGLYTLGMNYKQAVVIDGYTYRSLTIDGEIPFAECTNMRFNYCTDWTFNKFGGNKNPYKFYLTAGKHTLTLTVTLGESAEFYSRLSAISEVIGDTYIDIVMITSDSPDPNRDYELFRQIPNFQETLLTSYNDLKVLIKDMKKLSGDRSSKYISALNNMARVLKDMYDNQYTAQNYVSDFYSNYTTVCSWLYEMKTMPLNLDQIQLSGNGKFKDNTASFGESFLFGCKRFFASFTDEFSSIGGSVSANAKGKVRIWVNWGRDQTQVLSNLIQDSFTYETGIGVQLEIVNASLVNGLLAGNFPDMSLHLGRTDPVNLGMRGALYDLTNFSSKKSDKYVLSEEEAVKNGTPYLLDYEYVLKSRFQASAATPYWYNDQLFALPDTQSFFIMYYRTDVFENLGIDDPSTANNGLGWTWDEFIDAATILQRNNMQAYVPYTKIASTTTVNSGMGSLHMFPTMLAQNDVQLYNEAHNKTLLTSPEAISAFTKWTDFYTQYGIEKQMDFYNRFRVGTAPLGIFGYALYTQLTQAAPEIQGRWKITAIPGTVKSYNEDGSVAELDNDIAGAGTGCGVVRRSSNKDMAWQFLCWWTSTQTQLRYNNNVESILGAVSRTATANVQAFSTYSWNADDLEILLEQWGHVQELPEVPGGYYVSRAVDQAYWSVLNGEENEKDAMLEWGEVADNEIARKIAEYAGKKFN